MKLKKLFMSLLAVAGIASIASTTVNAAETGLTQNFDFSADGVGAVGGSNAFDIYAKSNVANEVLELRQHDGADCLYFGVTGNGADTTTVTPKLQIRDSGAANSVFNQEGKNVIIQTRYKTVRGYTKNFYIYESGLGTIQISNIKPLQHGNGKLESAQWHELSVVLSTTGGANGTGVIYAYADGALIQTIDVAAGKAFTGKINEVGFQLGKADYTYDEAFLIDYVKVAEYVGSTATLTETSKEVTVGDVFEIAAPTLDNANAPIANYNVVIADETILSYENNKFEAKAEGTTTVKFDYVDTLIEDKIVNVTVAAPKEAIKVADVQLNLFEEKITLGQGEQFKLNDLFTALPSAADNKELVYSIEEGASVISIEEGVLKGLTAGTAKVKVSATDGGEFSKVFDVVVNKGNFVDLNSYTVGTKWETAQDNPTLYTGWEALSYTKYKTFAPIEIVEDEVFGKAVKYTGVGVNPGAVDAGGSRIETHIPADKLTADKDYKLTAWIKVVNVSNELFKANYARMDFKVYGYKNGEDKPAYYTSAPYMHNSFQKRDIADQGWIQIELGVVNLDSVCVDGLKVELIAWQLVEGVEAYIANVQLVEMDTVKNNSWNVLTPEGSVTANAYELELGQELQLTTRAIPSSSVIPGTITFASSDDTIATVDATGKIVSVAPGTCTITATDGNKEVVINIVVTNEATSVTLPSETLELEVEEYTELDLTITPANATTQFTATSSDEAVVTTQIVNGKVAIMALTAGTATITVVSNDNEEVKFVLTITVTEPVVVVPPTVTLTTNSATIKVGETVQISATFTPEESTLTYTVADSSIATVDATGKVTAVKAGTTTITVANGEATATFTITVEAKEEPQPSDPQPSDPQPSEPQPSKGCKGSIIGSVMALVTLAGAVVLLKKKEQE